MSVVVLIENWEGAFKKTSYESLSYAKKIANDLSKECVALTFKASNPIELVDYGADKIINIDNLAFESTSNDNIAHIINDISNQEDSHMIIFSNTISSKSITPILANNMQAGLITNVIDFPENYSPLQIKCKAFSSKAYVKYESNYIKNIISIIPNAIGSEYQESGKGEIINVTYDKSKLNNNIEIINRTKQSEKISLSDADIVISAGRGLKGPENWSMIEELASTIGAATACSKPVSDMGWRPHSEHVGQTGLAINPDLYIAIGISGAIQHLAGVNSSKHIVVINTDPDAPFFQAADYGIIGDAFTVVPKLIEAFKIHNN